MLLVCTTVKRLRLFVVKEYSVDCARKNMDEIEILKLLGDHPNICQLLATTQLDSKFFKVKLGLARSVTPLNSWRDSDGSRVSRKRPKDFLRKGQTAAGVRRACKGLCTLLGTALY